MRTTGKREKESVLLASSIRRDSEGRNNGLDGPGEYRRPSSHSLSFDNSIYLEMRSESPAVANPGLSTTKCVVFPEGETMNWMCRSGFPGFTPVEIPVQSGFTV
jgi:hypothetical protein